MPASKTIGVLALQGGFSKHIAMLQRLKVSTQLVRKPADLALCDALIIPGGESTAIAYQIDYIGLRDPLKQFVESKPVFGTCAGMILLATEVINSIVPTLKKMDITVERNAFGRQTESFATNLTVTLKRSTHDFHSVFIRAPRIKKWGSDVKILAKLDDEPVLVQQGKCLAATFHPELTDDPLIHLYFINHVN